MIDKALVTDWGSNQINFVVYFDIGAIAQLMNDCPERFEICLSRFVISHSRKFEAKAYFR